MTTTSPHTVVDIRPVSLHHDLVHVDIAGIPTIPPPHTTSIPGLLDDLAADLDVTLHIRLHAPDGTTSHHTHTRPDTPRTVDG